MTSYAKTHTNGTLRSPNSYFVDVFFTVPDVACYELFVRYQTKKVIPEEILCKQCVPKGTYRPLLCSACIQFIITELFFTTDLFNIKRVQKI